MPASAGRQGPRRHRIPLQTPHISGQHRKASRSAMSASISRYSSSASLSCHAASPAPPARQAPATPRSRLGGGYASGAPPACGGRPDLARKLADMSRAAPPPRSFSSPLHCNGRPQPQRCYDRTASLGHAPRAQLQLLACRRGRRECRCRRPHHACPAQRQDRGSPSSRCRERRRAPGPGAAAARAGTWAAGAGPRGACPRPRATPAPTASAPRAPAVVQAVRGAPVQHLRRKRVLRQRRSRTPVLGCHVHVALDAATGCTLHSTRYGVASLHTRLRCRAHPQALLKAQRVAQRAAGAAPGVAARGTRPLAGGRVQRAQYRHERVQAAQLRAQRARVDRPGARQRQRQPGMHLLARSLPVSARGGAWSCASPRLDPPQTAHRRLPDPEPARSAFVNTPMVCPCGMWHPGKLLPYGARM